MGSTTESVFVVVICRCSALLLGEDAPVHTLGSLPVSEYAASDVLSTLLKRFESLLVLSLDDGGPVTVGSIVSDSPAAVAVVAIEIGIVRLSPIAALVDDLDETAEPDT
jgi:hypothetical protein